MRKKTHEEFVAQIKDRQFTVIGEYTGRHRKVSMRCNIDGHEWTPLAGNILKGAGCPICAGSTLNDAVMRERLLGRKISAEERYCGSGSKILFSCDVCGHKWKTSPGSIFRGKSCPSCSIKNRIKENKVLARYGDWVLIDISTKKHPSATSKIDLIDFNKIIGRISLGKRGYPLVNIANKLVAVHRLINPQWVETDHINRDRTDNRRSNLRECTHAENTRNVSLKTNNKSGFPGVSWDTARKKWSASIRVDGKTKGLGRYGRIEDAVKARKLAELKYFGTFSPHLSAGGYFTGTGEDCTLDA